MVCTIARPPARLPLTFLPHCLNLYQQKRREPPRRMSYRTIFLHLAAAALLLLSPSPAFAEEPPLPPGAETAGNAVPSQIMLRAARLMQAGRGDEATFWFYAGQLRWRSRLNGGPAQDPTGDPLCSRRCSRHLGRPSMLGPSAISPSSSGRSTPCFFGTHIIPIFAGSGCTRADAGRTEGPSRPDRPRSWHDQS
jgi:hypothetical protein